MTLTAGDIALYASAMLILFITPGPVWVALLARAMSGGFAAAAPLALGVATGDILWPLLAILGVKWIASAFEGFMVVMRVIASDSRLTRPGVLPGFMAGLAVILGNPKAILFYMGLLPGFFDLSRVTPPDIAVIVLISFFVPLLGNLSLALFVGRVKLLLVSPRAIRRTNISAGVLLMLVGLIIPFA